MIREKNNNKEENKVVRPQKDNQSYLDEEKDNDDIDKPIEKKEKSRKNTVITIVLGIIILLLLILFLRSCNNNGPKPDNKVAPIDVEFENDNTDDTKKEDAKRSRIDLIVFQDITIDEKNPNMRLGNSEQNDVYLSYLIKDTKNNKVYYESKMIKPGTKVDVNLKDILDEGVYKVSVISSCYDSETLQQYNGANQDITITVK